MKKKILLVLMLTILFCMTGCKSDSKVAFEYDKDTMIDMARDVVSSYNNVSGVKAEYYLSDGTDLEKAAVAGFKQADTSDHVGKFVGFDSNEKTEFAWGNHNNVLCSIYLKYENRDVKVTVSFVENKQFGVDVEEVLGQINDIVTTQGFESAEQFLSQNYAALGLQAPPESAEAFAKDYLISQGEKMYTADEIEVSAVYSRKELLLRAAKHTGIGMITVFCVLIFIAFIISLLKFVPALLGQTKKPEAPKAAPKAKAEAKPEAPKAPKVEEENLVNDEELVAVITAAIYAYESSNVKTYTTDSNDKLVVRSIRRVR